MKELVSSGATPRFYDYSFLFVPFVAVFINAIVVEDCFVKSYCFTLRFTHVVEKDSNTNNTAAEERWMDLVLILCEPSYGLFKTGFNSKRYSQI
jgi:hypothetical protein